MQIEIKSIEQLESGDLRAVVNMPLTALPKLVKGPDGKNKWEQRGPDPEDHAIQIPLAALTSRMELYDLASREEALDAILKEHTQRLNGLPEEPHSDAKTQKLGGHRKDVTIDKSNQNRTPEAAKVLSDG